MVLFFIAISVTPSAVASCFKLTTFRERLIRAHELGRRQPALHSTVGNSASSYTPPSVRAFNHHHSALPCSLSFDGAVTTPGTTCRRKNTSTFDLDYPYLLLFPDTNLAK